MLMAKIVLKCRYLSSPEKSRAKNLIRYIATREGVVKQDKRENYIGYIANRPGAEKRGSHGLFDATDTPPILSKVSKEIASHKGNVWTNVLSLTREDAKRLGYEDIKAWQNLLRKNAYKIADAMKIPAEDLVWYAAFHNESYHPHIHMVMYSKGKEAYLSEKGIRMMKSAFAKEIFCEDLIPIYELQTQRRNYTAEKTESLIREILQSPAKNPLLIEKFSELSEKLKSVKGRKVYGYLPKDIRKLVDDILTELSKDESITAYYEAWQEGQEEIEKIYRENPARRESLSENKEFRNLKNKVITEAVNFAGCGLTFEKEIQPFEDENEETLHSRTLYFEAVSCFKAGDAAGKEQGMRLLEKAAEEGLDTAQYQLGKMYLFGQGVLRDEEKGKEFLKKAAMQDNPYAESILKSYRTHEPKISEGLYIMRILGSFCEEFPMSKSMRQSQMTENKLRRQIEERKRAKGIRSSHSREFTE